MSFPQPPRSSQWGQRPPAGDPSQPPPPQAPFGSPTAPQPASASALPATYGTRVPPLRTSIGSPPWQGSAAACRIGIKRNRGSTTVTFPSASRYKPFGSSATSPGSGDPAGDDSDAASDAVPDYVQQGPYCTEVMSAVSRSNSGAGASLGRSLSRGAAAIAALVPAGGAMSDVPLSHSSFPPGAAAGAFLTALRESPQLPLQQPPRSSPNAFVSPRRSSSNRQPLSPTVSLTFPTLLLATQASGSPSSAGAGIGTGARFDAPGTPAVHSGANVALSYGPSVPISPGFGVYAAASDTSAAAAGATVGYGGGSEEVSADPAAADGFWRGLIDLARTLVTLPPPSYSPASSVDPSHTSAGSVSSGWATGALSGQGSPIPLSSTMASLTLSQALTAPVSNSGALPGNLFTRIPLPTVLLLCPPLLQYAAALGWRTLDLDSSRDHACLHSTVGVGAGGSSGAADASGGCPPLSVLRFTAGYPVCAAAAGPVHGVPSLILALCPVAMRNAGISLAEAILAVDGAATAGAGARRMPATAAPAAATAAAVAGPVMPQLLVWAVLHGPGITPGVISDAKRAHTVVREAVPPLPPVSFSTGTGSLAAERTAAVAAALTAPTLTQLFAIVRADPPGATVIKVTGQTGGSWVGPVICRVT